MTHFREVPARLAQSAGLAGHPARLSGGYSIWTITKIAGSNVPFTAVFAASASIALSLWLLSLRLEVEAADEALRLRYRFLWFPKQIDYSAIDRAEAIEYKPLRGYGGWGIRRGKYDGHAEWAWTVTGSHGVRLLFKDGDTFLLGSRRPQELAGAVNARIPAVREPNGPFDASK